MHFIKHKQDKNQRKIQKKEVKIKERLRKQKIKGIKLINNINSNASKGLIKQTWLRNLFKEKSKKMNI